MYYVYSTVVAITTASCCKRWRYLPCEQREVILSMINHKLNMQTFSAMYIESLALVTIELTLTVIEVGSYIYRVVS